MDNDKTVFVNIEKETGKDELDRIYMELGKEYYEGAFEDPLPQLLPLFEKITSIKKKNCKEEERKETRYCTECGNILSQEDAFCGRCGTKIL